MLYLLAVYVVFESGFYGAIVGILFISVLHILLALCMAEMTSVIPFAGGSFGYARCTLGPFWGYLVGASELLQNFFYGCALVRELGRNAEIAFDPNDPNVRQKSYVVFYTAVLLTHCIGGSFYWRSVNLFGLLAVSVIMMFLIESFGNYDLQHYGFYKLDGFDADHVIFLRKLHYLIPPFMGIQILPLTCERVIDVRKNLPIALVVCTCVSAVVLIIVIVAAAGSPPGVSSKLYKTRCSMCYMMINNLDMTVEQGNVLSMVVIMGSTLGYCYSCGHQMQAMANSGLLPQFLRRTFGPNRQPVTCFVISMVLQCAACIWLHYDFKQFSTTRMTCISVSCVYLAIFASYMVFATRFRNMQREFTSPFGLYGAVFGMVLALGLWIGTMFFQENYMAMSIYLVYIGINIVWYFAYVQFYQFFSEEEQNKFLRAYVTNGK
jgi:amino acid transporter